jgi:hypothetical protein
LSENLEALNNYFKLEERIKFKDRKNNGEEKIESQQQQQVNKHWSDNFGKMKEFKNKEKEKPDESPRPFKL